MPINLITGFPGHGKTLYTLAKYRDISAAEGRPVFYRGIKDLKLPWTEFDPEKWQELPPTAILIVDEAQQVFPLRGRGSPPDWIEKLAVHRHHGIDIVLITQNPMLLDSFVRRLIDRHFHVVRKFGTKFATIHEFANGVKENVAASRAGSITHEWRYPKDVFDLYHSAEVHTVKTRVPGRVWLLMALPFLLAGLVWWLYSRLQPEAVADRVTGPGASASAPGAVGRVVPGRPGERAAVGPLPVGEYLAMHQPRVPGLAYTAPVYDSATVPTDAPYPAACLSSAKRGLCQCYSQQGTKLEVPKELCQSIADGGFFVAWARESAAGRGGGGALPAPPGGLVVGPSVARPGGGGGTGLVGMHNPRFTAGALTGAGEAR